MTISIYKTIFLKVVPERVWAFLTEPELQKLWMHPSEKALAEGDDVIWLNDEGGRHCWGKVLLAKPFEHLVYEFTHQWIGGHITTVTWRLQAVESGTLLHMAHDGIEGGEFDLVEMLTSHEVGWDHHFIQLRDILNVQN